MADLLTTSPAPSSSIALSSVDVESFKQRHREVFQPPLLKRYGLLITFILCVVYSLYCWWFFAIGKTLEQANWHIAGSYLADWVSYEARPDVEFEGGYFEITYPRFSPLGDNPKPEWIKTRVSTVTIKDEQSKTATSVAEPQAGISFMAPKKPAQKPTTEPVLNFMAPASSATQDSGSDNSAETIRPPVARQEEKITEVVLTVGDATIKVEGDRVEVAYQGDSLVANIQREQAVIPATSLPAWAVQKRPGEKIKMSFGWAGRAEIQNDEVKINKRFFGWENFWFDTNSKLWPLSGGDRIAAIFGGERLEPTRSNLSLAWEDFLYNPSWQHYDVWLKLLQTIVMAFVGTLFATFVAFPLAFFAARNITPNRFLNHTLKRLFDYFRSVDMLIWALFFTRGFGPGPLAGISAIFLTDTGTLGKLYSEALENIDDRQREGVKSVGANTTLIQRYGVVPQVLPVFLSQSLYFWESNTRSATIIGAVGAGGIGLKLWEAMRTNQDWENVAVNPGDKMTTEMVG